MLWWLNLIFVSQYLVLDVCDVIIPSELSNSLFIMLVLDHMHSFIPVWYNLVDVPRLSTLNLTL